MQQRDYMKVRDRLLADCKRAAFAKIARYTKGVDDGSGDTVTRASIHFALAAMRYLGNLDVEQPMVSDTKDCRIVRVQITDKETDSTYSKEIVLEKARATEDDLATKEAELASKVQRQLILKLLPADITAECMAQVAETMGDAEGHPGEYQPTKETSRAASLATALKNRKKATK